MDFIINLGAKLNGLTATVMDLLPLLGALGGILGVASSVLLRASAAHDPAGVFHAVHPTVEEAAVFSTSLGVLRAHFKHNDNKAAIAAVAPAELPVKE